MTVQTGRPHRIRERDIPKCSMCEEYKGDLSSISDTIKDWRATTTNSDFWYLIRIEHILEAAGVIEVQEAEK
jgi:hypothetical protein